MDRANSRAITEELKRQIKARMQREHPQFQGVGPKVVPAFCELFQWPIAEGLTSYLLFTIDRGERFTVEVAWTRNGRWPGSVLPAFRPRDIPERNLRRDEPKDGDFRFRMPALWLPRGDHEWELVTRPDLEEINERLREFDRTGFPDRTGSLDDPPLRDLLAMICPLLDDAFAKIDEYAIPYLREIADSHGVAVDLPP